MSTVSQPKTERQKVLNQCAVDICQSQRPEDTYKHHFQSVIKKAVNAKHYDEFFRPEIEGMIEREKEELARWDGFSEKLKAIDEPVVFDDQMRRTYAFLDFYDRATDPLYQVSTNLPPSHPNYADWDPFYLSKPNGIWIDDRLFQIRLENGGYTQDEYDPLQIYHMNRDRELLSYFNSDQIDFSIFTNLIHKNGRGSGSFLDLVGSSTYDYFNGVTDTEKWRLLRTISGPERSREFSTFASSFLDVLIRARSFSSFEYWLLFSDFAQAVLMKEFHNSIGDHPYFDQINEVVLAPEEAKDLAKKIDVLVKRDMQRITSGQLLSETDASCRLKLNTLMEGLPTEEEIQVAKPKVTKAIVDFQSWLFNNMSSETATAFFEKQKGWDVFYPPEKHQFKYFLRSYLNINQPSDFDSQSKAALVLAKSYNKDSMYNVGMISRADRIIDFCDSISMNPVSDHALPNQSQVYLSWMSLKDDRFLKTVVWHELGHLLSGLLKGDFVGEKTRPDHPVKIDYPVSLESATKLFSSFQCLGDSQNQKTTFRPHLTRQYLRWFDNGQMTQFEGVGSLKYKDGQILSRVGSMYPSELSNSSPEAAYFRGISFIQGEFVEEDWADMIAGQIDDDETNPLCFMMKDQDHLFWNQFKGMRNQDLPRVKQLKVSNKISERYGYAPYDYGWTKDELDQMNASTSKHSLMFFRLLHLELSRKGFLPPSCQQAQKLDDNLSNIRRCDFF